MPYEAAGRARSGDAATRSTAPQDAPAAPPTEAKPHRKALPLAPIKNRTWPPPDLTLSLQFRPLPTVWLSTALRCRARKSCAGCAPRWPATADRSRCASSMPRASNPEPRLPRCKDYATNVLTFDYAQEPVVMADLVLCAPVVARGRRAGKTPQQHYAHLLVHGRCTRRAGTTRPARPTPRRWRPTRSRSWPVSAFRTLRRLKRNVDMNDPRTRLKVG